MGTALADTNGGIARALARDEWQDLARKLDWRFSYVSEQDAFPEPISGKPWLTQDDWAGWDEPFRISFAEYVRAQSDKEAAVAAVADALGRAAERERLAPEWNSGLKLHAALLPLAEFAAVVGNLRAVRFGRDSAWRSMALFGALDELRHTQIPLRLMHPYLAADAQYDWTHRFYHSNDWVAIAARHCFDELLLLADPIEFAVATNFVFETGFTNLQFTALTALCDSVGDRLLEQMLASIQTDEARHAQIGPAVLEILVQHDRAYAQYLLDKWFWRSFLLFAVATGFTMDYLTPVERRTQSFKEFMHEWVLTQFVDSLARYGLQRPWYWAQFEQALDYYHHMVYASAYSYRASVWFHLALPGPAERDWLRSKYPQSFPALEPVWENITQEWGNSDAGVDLAVHGTAIPTFCSMCQIVLCGGTPAHNSVCQCRHEGATYTFCSEPCRWIFRQDPARYARHKDVVKRVLAGEAPGNLIAFLTQYSGLSFATWGKDAYGGDYAWLRRGPRSGQE
ncbi:MAG: YHS domain-containing protein [Rhodocyclaceae bacterium]|nr:YHS domain-containing protein [Rhodocyclaceae bacterium]